MRFYAPIAKVDAAEHMVWGYASTEAEDDQGEIVSRTALAAALADYMKFANIREMHRMSAVGVAEEAAVDEHGLHVGARIVDPGAWEKVRAGVYKGFSIGGRVKSRDPADRRVITALALSEISLVDRPANPEAVFDCWKSEGGEGMAEAANDLPIQLWHCGVAGHRHLAKAEAVHCLERRVADGDATEDRDYADPGLQPDGEKRYPIDSEAHIRAAWAFIHQAANAVPYSAADLAQVKARIVAAWRAKIDPAGPPAAEADRAGNKDAASLDAMLGRLEDCLKALGEVGLAKAFVGEILPRLDLLAKRVDEIAATPLPPLTAARGIAKREDGGAAAPEDVVAALARMSEEERTIALIKAAHATPVRPR